MSSVNNSFIAYAAQRLPYTNGWYGMPYWSVMFSTGPLFLWLTYLGYPCKDHVHILTVKQASEEYFIHMHESSWHSWDGVIFRCFDHLWQYSGRGLIFVAILVILTIVLALRYVWPCASKCSSDNNNIVVLLFGNSNNK